MSVANANVNVNEWAVAPPEPCVACGNVHGSVNAEINCLRAFAAKYKAGMAALEELQKKAAALDAIRALGESVQKLKCSRGGLFEELQTGKRKPSSYAQG